MNDRLEVDGSVNYIGKDIIYAAECSSHTWGFARPDSDHDVRVIFLQDEYLTIEAKTDTVRKDFTKTAGPDVSGWDLRKTFQLLKGSNPAVIEALLSPIVYTEKDERYLILRQLAIESYNPIAYYWHHNKMGYNMLKDIEASETVVSAKKYLYALRSAMTCYWIRKAPDTIPPLTVQGLSQLGGMNEDVDDWIEWVKCGDVRRCSSIEFKLSNEFSLGEELSKNVPSKKPNLDFDRYFRYILGM